MSSSFWPLPSASCCPVSSVPLSCLPCTFGASHFSSVVSSVAPLLPALLPLRIHRSIMKQPPSARGVWVLQEGSSSSTHDCEVLTMSACEGNLGYSTAKQTQGHCGHCPYQKLSACRCKIDCYRSSVRRQHTCCPYCSCMAADTLLLNLWGPDSSTCMQQTGRLAQFQTCVGSRSMATIQRHATPPCNADAPKRSISTSRSPLACVGPRLPRLTVTGVA